MKNKKLLFLPLLAMLLASCAGNGASSEPSESENSSNNSQDSSSEVISEDKSSEDKSSEDSYVEESEESWPIPSQNEDLPIGNKSLPGPRNKEAPVDISEYTTFDFHSSMPNNWSHIKGNNKFDTTYDFYSNEEGGFKLSHLYYGLQSPVLTSWKKVEITMNISQLNNSSKKVEKGKNPIHFYAYDINGHFLEMIEIEQGQITVQNKKAHIYFRNPDMAYFEMRLNTYVAKGSQCYNLGIENFVVKGWDFE